MNCPNCGAPQQEVRVIETSHTAEQVRRRRECGLCKQRFSTAEVIVKDYERTATRDVLLIPKS